jgi:isopropylmalate/homocitrate/citramalate synthase
VTELREEELIHDWNRHSPEPELMAPRVVDHTLACARLTASLRVPDLQGQVTAVELLSRLGLGHLCLGSWCDPEVRKLALESEKLEVQPWVEAPPGPHPAPFCGAYYSHRQKGWRQRAEEFSGESVFVIQDATRRTPPELVQLLSLLPGSRVGAVCLSDDGGRATPAGAARLVTFVRQALARLEAPVEIEWSGRNDRGLALASALAAWRAGATTLHSSFFSLGEGCGLISTELLLVNLSLSRSLSRDLSALGEVTRSLAQLLGVELYANLPVIGADAFRTGTGVHAAAIMKAQKKGHDWLADLIYSGVPAGQFGFRQIIEVGPMAGASNVHFWLQQQGREPGPELVQAILTEAKSSQRVLSDEEIWSVVRRHEQEVKA